MTSALLQAGRATSESELNATPHHAERDGYEKDFHHRGLTMSAPPSRVEIQCYDPRQDVLIVERKLPHWSQAGTLCFITWRTWDSIPKPVLERWLADRWRFLESAGIDPRSANWRERLRRLPTAVQAEFQRVLADRWNDELDRCHGACPLRREKVSKVVANSLVRFDGDRYEMTDFVIMPNHVHLLAAFPTEEAMLKQCESWKHYTAVRINRILGRSRRFWQQDGFDHLVRTPDEFDRLRRYIADNPRNAGLLSGEYVHQSKKLS